MYYSVIIFRIKPLKKKFAQVQIPGPRHVAASVHRKARVMKRGENGSV